MGVGLHHLRYFVGVAEEGQVSRAASRLHVAQPSLSAALRSLEASVGTALLRRHPRGVELTPAGEAFLAHARLAVEAADRAADAARAAARAETGHVGIGMIVGTQTPMTSRILSEFGRRHPEARLELAEFDFADPSAGQRSQRVDVAFVMPPIDGPELRFLTLHEVPRVAVVPAGHRLAARASIAVAELFDDPWIVADTADEVCRAYWLAAEHRTAPPLIGAGTRTIDKFVQLVAAGQVVGLAASWVASVFARPDVVYLPVEDIAPARVALAWRADAANPLVPRLVDIARTLTDV